THTLIWRNKADLEEHSLDDLFNSLKIYEDEVKHSSSIGTTTENLAFTSSSNTDSTTESVSAAASVFAICTKMPVSSLPNVDSLSLESVEARLLVYKQNEFVFEEDIKFLNLEVQLRDNALVTLRQKLEKSAQERDDLKLKLENFQTSFKNLTELLASQTNEKTGTFMPPKPNLVFNIASTAVETDHSTFNVQLSPTKHDQDLSHTNRPTTPIIEDWISDSKDESETKAP
nr:hypothetical protein [Tanacetum cinerariifolium]